MKSFDLKGTARTIAERSSAQARALKAMRRAGDVPCVLYGGKENVHFTVTAESLRKLVYSPDIFVINLDIDGHVCKAIVQDLQFHPVKDNVLHVDFLEIVDGKPIVIEVPVQLNGLAEGVKAGGKLALQIRKLKVKAMYDRVPEHLDIDVTPLGLGKTIKVGELSYDGIELLNAKDAVVCAVQLTRAARGAAAAAASAK
ncbi:MAG: 50S ribosomal protein L25/general stress protein Ctc [Prevotellaceae bacterium]|jgi:large subunit ribosomal protein L25|nr:50S ribosomal protein L25/general stress protein Ctc [Prevotellaceae bacterium]